MYTTIHIRLPSVVTNLLTIRDMEVLHISAVTELCLCYYNRMKNYNMKCTISGLSPRNHNM